MTTPNLNYQNDDRLKAEALFKLFRERTFLGEIEVEYGKQGREIVRKAVRNTSGIVLLFLILIPILLKLPLFSGYPFALFVFSLAVCLIFVFLVPHIYFRINNKNRNGHEIKIDWLQGKLSNKTLLFRLFWYTPVLVTPFSIRTVWLWTLVFGYYRAIHESGITLTFSLAMDWNVLNKFSEEFLKALLLVIVAYIATNIISELLALRDAYAQGTTEVGGLKNKIENLSQTLEEKNTEIKYIFDEIQLSQNLKELFGKLSNKRLGREFIKSLNASIRTYSKSFRDKPRLDIFILSALSGYLNLEVKHFEEEKKLITKFDLFGDIVHLTLEELLLNESVEIDKFEIFTIVVIPPKKFICYDQGNNKNTPNWMRYLKTNYKVRNILNQYRHFLSVDYSRNTIRGKNPKILKELNEIEVLKIKEELQNIELHVASNWSDSINEEIPIHQTGTEQEGITFSDSEQDIEGYKKMALSDVLANVFHKTDCCKVIEVKIYNDQDINEVKPLVDVAGGFLLDYYAVKYDGKWMFCYRAKYEESLNTAHIELFHSEMPKDTWNPVEADLEKIFTKKTRKSASYSTGIGEVFDITSYGKN